MGRKRLEEDVLSIQKRLVGWYRKERREMPWRETNDPYAIWVSEIMLQQTQVETVKPYYLRFLKCFPTVRVLAKARIEDVLKCWEGLGYYSRARNLHKAAKIVVAEYGGELPKDMTALKELPGIGAYTAGAIASIAFGLDEPVLDGNVTRVLCRLFCVRWNPKEGKTQKRLWDLARELMPKGKADVFNQALMDLGAMICTPRGPKCPACPVQKHCRAYANDEQDKLPVKIKRKALPHYDIVAGVICRRGKILIDQRKHEGLLGGLWELPGGKVEKGETHEAALVREVREEVGIEIKVGEKLTTVRHAYSHFRITLHAFMCRHVSGRARAIECEAVKWIRLDEIEDYAFPKANRKIIARLKEIDSVLLSHQSKL